MAGTKHIVYMATNIANGKRYIGYTSVGLEKRKSKHHLDAFGGQRRGYRLHDALRKYGKEAFVWTVLSVMETEAEGFAEEIRLIAELKPEYNVTVGGEGTRGLPAWNRKPVTCLTDGKMFVSATAAARHYGLNLGYLTEVCLGRQRNARNELHFIYGDIEYSAEERRRLILDIEATHAVRRKRVALNKSYGGISNGLDTKGRSAAGPMRNARAVICLDDGKTYASASEAGRVYNVARSSIIELCLGKNGRVTVGGRRFKYVET